MNAERIVNRSTRKQGQALFNQIVKYLSEYYTFEEMVIGGTQHKIITMVMDNVIGDRIPSKQTNVRAQSLGEWWSFASNFLRADKRRAVILSVLEKDGHLTVARRITKRKIFVVDSNWRAEMLRENCTTPNVARRGRKTVIYPAQCWYLGAK